MTCSGKQTAFTIVGCLAGGFVGMLLSLKLFPFNILAKETTKEKFGIIFTTAASLAAAGVAASAIANSTGSCAR
jgi:hypothetical protein